MASRIFQGILLQMKDAAQRAVGVIDGHGVVVACSELTRIGEHHEEAAVELQCSTNAVCVYEGWTYKALASWSARFDFAVFVDGDDEMARALCQMAAVTLNGAKAFHDEKHDKATFIKNILMDNVLPGDIYARSLELHFEEEQPRLVMLIRQVNKSDMAAVDVLQSMFPDKKRDFVISLGESEIALVKEVYPGLDAKEIRRIALSVEEALSAELYVKTVIGVGTVVSHLKDLATSYREAQVAIEVGKVFDTEKTIVHFENLGIGRLIYQLPITMCEMFLSEVFKKNSIDALDQETLFTIQKFFENNLNVSETSRKLFVHRNTLVYRLEKIKKITGLDLREFDHAIIFKVALMVRRYLNSQTQ